MKNFNQKKSGFALPTILIVSVVMLLVLMAAVSSVASVRVSLSAQYYNKLAENASDAGVQYAKACLDSNDGIPLWSDAMPLTPHSDCSGVQITGLTCDDTSADANCYVMLDDTIRTSFSVGKPTVDYDGRATNVRATGTVRLVRRSNNMTWRTYTQTSHSNLNYDGLITDGLVLNLDASNSDSYSGAGSNWSDISGLNRGGVLQNGVGYSTSGGKALTFDGTNDYVRSNKSKSLGFNDDNITVEAWVNPSAIPNRPTIFSTREANRLGAFQLELSAGVNGTGSVMVTGQNTIIAETKKNAVSVNMWQHIVYTKTGTTQTIYVNGASQTLATTNAFTVTDSDDSYLVGAGTTFLSMHYFSGKIGAVRVYNRALSASEVDRNFNATRGEYAYRYLDVLVVGGGGGGGSAGGGGAGGLIYKTSTQIAAGSYSVTIGSGGNGGSATVQGASGGNTVFAQYTAYGGGGGGKAMTAGSVGGSGGGGGTNQNVGDVLAGGAVTDSAQGNSGGTNNGYACSPSGGGGGAGGAGAGSSSSSGGAGGAGLSVAISGTSTYYAGGGGGGAYCTAGGAGGSSIGGAGVNWTAGGNAVANTGSGGGGGQTGGAGSAGIVIIRYPTGTYSATGGEISTNGGYTIHTFKTTTSNKTFVIN